MMFLKVVLVLICLLAGALFLAHGWGAPIPFLGYRGFEAVDLPVGSVFFATGILLAIFWKIKKTITTEEVKVKPDGETHLKRTKIDYQLHNRNDPRDPPGPTSL